MYVALRFLQIVARDDVMLWYFANYTYPNVLVGYV